MDILAATNIPDMPPIEWTRDICIAVALALALLGVLLMWKGLRLSRWLLMLAGAAGGWGIADAANIQIGDLNWYLTAAICAAVGAIVGFLLARLLLAFWAGAIVAAGALYWIITENVANVADNALPKFQPMPEGATSQDWAIELQRVTETYMQETWNEKSWVALGILAAAAIIPILFALLLKKHAVIFITSLFGAILGVAAFAIAARAVDMSNDPRVVFTGMYSLIAIGVLTIAGTTVQHVFKGKKKSGDGEGGSE